MKLPLTAFFVTWHARGESPRERPVVRWDAHTPGGREVIGELPVMRLHGLPSNWAAVQLSWGIIEEFTFYMALVPYRCTTQLNGSGA